jgi:hypothetical protein
MPNEREEQDFTERERAIILAAKHEIGASFERGRTEGRKEVFALVYEVIDRELGSQLLVSAARAAHEGLKLLVRHRERLLARER